MNWRDERDTFVECMKDPFNPKNINQKSIEAKNREEDIDNFMRRITPQIIEQVDNCLDFSTPELWDKNFYSFGGGQSRRKSSAILSRMTWNKFIELSDTIVGNYVGGKT